MPNQGTPTFSNQISFDVELGEWLGEIPTDGQVIVNVTAIVSVVFANTGKDRKQFSSLKIL